MYISVNKDSMCFLHKHNDCRVVRSLAELESPHAHIVIFPCNDNDEVTWCRFTDLELLKLYRNTTGSLTLGFYRPGLENLCYKAASALPDSDAVAWEIDIQVRSLSEGDTGRYRYVKGSTIPAPVDELFNEPCFQSKLALTDEAHAATLRPKAVAYTQPTSAPGIAPTGRDHPVANSSARGATAAATIPRGGQRHVIWEVADEHWQTAGKPLEISKVVKLRSLMMDVLETRGIKRTSASSELGNWMKVRVLAK